MVRKFFNFLNLFKVLKCFSDQCTCCLYGEVHSGFEGGKSITRAILGGGGTLKIKTFLGPEMHGTRVGPKKVKIFRASPKNGPSYGFAPHKKPFYTSPI
jgi:hypothetical protein